MKNIIHNTCDFYIIPFILLSVIFLIYYLHRQNTKLSISKYHIKNKKIPKAFNDYKIAQISDFHNYKCKVLVEKIIIELKKENPDIIVLTGDMVDYRKPDTEYTIFFIKQLTKIAKVFFVGGNHEIKLSNYTNFKNKLKNNNVTILSNSLKEITKEDQKINIIGLEDPKLNGISNLSDVKVLQKILNQLNYNKDFFTILLSHRPEFYDFYFNNDVDITFSGHTHGGLIRLPFIGPLFAPGQGIFPKYACGIIGKNNKKIIINRGLGKCRIPFRINNRPELVIVNLKKG